MDISHIYAVASVQCTTNSAVDNTNSARTPTQPSCTDMALLTIHDNLTNTALGPNHHYIVLPDTHAHIHDSLKDAAQHLAQTHSEGPPCCRPHLSCAPKHGSSRALTGSQSSPAAAPIEFPCPPSQNAPPDVHNGPRHDGRCRLLQTQSPSSAHRSREQGTACCRRCFMPSLPG